MNRWITADYHLGEDRFEIMGRPFSDPMEMVTTLIELNNKVVAYDDELIIVGDVCYQKRPEFLCYLASFNGRKTLIRGNHDRGISDKEFAPYFEKIIPEGEGLELEVDGIPCFATHYPTRGVKDRFNLVGHIHTAYKYQLNMLNIGVDVHHFRPVNLNKINFHFKAICEFYDKDVWIAYDEVNSSYFSSRGKKSSYFNPSSELECIL